MTNFRAAASRGKEEGGERRKRGQAEGIPGRTGCEYTTASWSFWRVQPEASLRMTLLTGSAVRQVVSNRMIEDAGDSSTCQPKCCYRTWCMAEAKKQPSHRVVSATHLPKRTSSALTSSLNRPADFAKPKMGAAVSLSPRETSKHDDEAARLLARMLHHHRRHSHLVWPCSK